jgi:hypothetical protein
MSSVLRFLKQTPADTQYFVAISANPVLNTFYSDAAASTTSYVSGAAAGYFSTSTLTVAALGTTGQQSTLSLFRDMGVTIVSSGRTFRRVQLLRLDQGITTGSAVNNGWSSQGTSTQGVWQPSVEGVNGDAGPNSGSPDTAFSCFYFETGARGLGIAQGLIRYG